MITGLHCSTVFSSQFTDTAFVLQYISSCVINMLNQFRAYISAYHCRKYISWRASRTPFVYVQAHFFSWRLSLWVALPYLWGEEHMEGLISGVNLILLPKPRGLGPEWGKLWVVTKWGGDCCAGGFPLTIRSQKSSSFSLHFFLWTKTDMWFTAKTQALKRENFLRTCLPMDSAVRDSHIPAIFIRHAANISF